MRTLYLAIPVSLLLVASNAVAQSKDYPATDRESVSTVQVTAPPHVFHVTNEDTDWISGGYKMTNGWRMDVQPTDDGIVAKIDKERPIHLVALSPNNYVTADGNVAMEFNRGTHGDEMMMSYVPSSNLASVVVMTATVASR